MPDKFNLTGSCVKGGFYFTNARNIFNYLEYNGYVGYYVREVYLPISDPEFIMVKDPDNDKSFMIMMNDPPGDKWRANKIILGSKLELSKLDTIKYLIQEGADPIIRNNLLIRWAVKMVT
ncbi:ankyrin-containing protein [Acanthamoeba polyphaga mimivirus]|uniref:Ankyrin-containing protein n=1 Tax=Acanthamoeba polyphaga mimivirus TaxID=212035 RepID=F8V5F0_MIMIV|nr:ankyrin-containing protein [Acanthamoeba polyphaga mimivirus]